VPTTRKPDSRELPTGFRYRLFRAIARLDVAHPWLVLAVCAALAAGSILYTKSHLEFQTGQEDLVTGDSRDTRNYHRYENEFPDLDGLIVVVRVEPDPARAEAFADRLAARLAADPANVKSVFYKIDPGMLAGRALLYLSLPDLNDLAAGIRDHRDFLKGYAAEPTLQNFFALTNAEANRAMSAAMMSGLLGSRGNTDAPKAGTLDLDFIDAVLEGMAPARGARAAMPWDRLTGAGAHSGVVHDGYLASENGKYLLMNVAPGDGVDGGPDPVDAIESDLAVVRAGFPGLEAGITGGPALARAEASATEHDIALASVIAVVSNVLLVVIPFAGVVEPAFALAALLIGVAWSFGFTTLAVGHLNLLSAVFTSVLAGIGINFPIHMMARYDEARRAGRPMNDAVRLGVVNTGAGVVASACIMALAFLMPSFTDFRGIAELGLVSAAGLFLCLISALLVFPALVAIRDRRAPVAARAVKVAATKPRLPRLFARPWLIVGAAAAVTVVASPLILRLSFDQNLLKLQAENTEAVRFEERLLKDSGRSSWFAVSLASTRAEAERKAAAFRKLPEVSDSETIANYIPDEQVEKRATLASLRPVIDSITVRPLTHPSDPAGLARELDSLAFKLNSASGRDPKIDNTAALLARASARLAADPAAVAAYEGTMAAGLADKLAEFKRDLDPDEVTERGLPAVLRDHFIGKSGAYLVQIYPRGDVWSDAPLQRFVTALRSVDPDVTGPPVQTWSIASVMRRGYERAGLFALIAVFIFVFADFRNLRDAALATVPLLFGGLWLIEAMGALGWEFNLANLFAVPIIIGTGVDNGVNMLYRWREERDRAELILTRSVGKSVTIASLTTIAGFAALIPATHRGISSLGWVLALGVTFILGATLVVLPALFEIVGRRIDGARGRTEQPLAQPRRAAGARRSGMLALAAACALALSAPGVARAAADSRAESNRMVAEAEKMIEQAGKTTPVDTARVYGAINELHDALRVDPRNDSAYVDLGFCYGLVRDGPAAVEMYTKATQINPSGANFKELADIYLRIGQPENALMAANAGVIKDPANASLYNAKGMALNDLQRFDEALAAFKKAVKLDPSLAAARENLRTLSGRLAAGSSAAPKRPH
jgi:uncharacterized protein